jgi:hypothetical protein
MKMHPALLALLVITTSGADASTRAELARKCPPGSPVLFPNAQDWVYLMDRKPITAEAFEQADKGQFESIQMVCAAPLHDTFAVEARVGGVVVFTVPGPTAALNSAMDRIEQLQAEHLARTGEFAKDLAALGWTDPSGMVTVDLEVSGNGSSWTARGAHRYLLPPHSRLVMGSKP